LASGIINIDLEASVIFILCCSLLEKIQKIEYDVFKLFSFGGDLWTFDIHAKRSSINYVPKPRRWRSTKRKIITKFVRTAGG
jgi:hypothetical protein